MKHLIRFFSISLALISTCQIFSIQVFVLDTENPTMVVGAGNFDASTLSNQLNTNADLFDVIINPVTADAYQPQGSYIIDQILFEAHHGPAFVYPSGDNISYSDEPIEFDVFETLISPNPSQKVYFFVKRADLDFSINEGFFQDWNRRISEGEQGPVQV